MEDVAHRYDSFIIHPSKKKGKVLFIDTNRFTDRISMGKKILRRRRSDHHHPRKTEIVRIRDKRFKID